MSNKGDSQDERVSRPTERGLQWQLELKLRDWRSATTLWRRNSNKLRAALTDEESNIEIIRHCRDVLQDVMDRAIAAQEELSTLAQSLTVEDDGSQRLEEMEEEHAMLMKDTHHTLKRLRGDDVTSKSSVSSKSIQERCQKWINDSKEVNQGDKQDSDAPSNTSCQDRPKEPSVASEKIPSVVNPLAECLRDQLHLNRLPLPEPVVFNGNPLDYFSWKNSYELLIEHSNIPSHERFFYLMKYLKDEPHDLVCGFSILGDETAYHDAKRALDDRYGDHFVISNAFREKLNKWPKIGPGDARGLRKLADYLRQCCTAMNMVTHLRVLNDEHENRKVLSKLPNWLVNRWKRIVAESRRVGNQFPSFHVFCKFVEDEAAIACDPVTSPSPSQAKNRKGQPQVTSFSTGTQDRTTINGGKKETACIFCKEQHFLGVCTLFSVESLQDRKKFVFEHGLCFACLKPGHRAKDCKRKGSCSICKGRHPTVLHDENWVNRQQSKDASNAKREAETQTSSSHASSNQADITQTSKTSTIVPVWLSHETTQEERLVYAMLDTQSDTTFILDKTKQAIEIEGIKVTLLLSTMTLANERVASEKVTGLKVRAFNGTKEVRLPPTFTRSIMPANRSHIPTPETAKAFPHLRAIADDMIPLQDCEIGLLIGYDCATALLPRAVIASPEENGPFGIQTVLGWSIVGTVDLQPHNASGDTIGTSHRVMVRVLPRNLQRYDEPSQVVFSRPSTLKEEIVPQQVVELFESEFAPERGKPYSQNDMKFLKIMETQVHISKDGRYEMPLPFSGDTPSLPNNRILAERRLNNLKRKFERDSDYHELYSKQMSTLLENNYAEEIKGPGEEGKCWYIPHHGVQQPNKLRVVFDCSSQFEGVSLNAHLLTGPDLTNTLTGVLCRFRRENIAFMCDVKEMFHQFHVNEDHRDYLRFLWWPNGDFRQDPIDYRMNVHLFGAASSPGCANFGLKQIAKDNSEEFGQQAVDFIHHDFYVDDGLKSVATEEKAIDLIRKTKKLCERGCLHLHKFVSNSRRVMHAIPAEDRAKGVRELNILQDALPIEKALGVQWCIESDALKFRLTFKDKPLSRRGVLSTVMSVYDPLGLLAPLMLRGRQILQQLCKDSAAWDDPLPEILKVTWEKWKSDMIKVARISIRRCYKPENFGMVKNMQLHHFSDASNIGYGQCSYLRLTDEDRRTHCTLVMAKSRVAPLKTVTMPRLELTAALLSVNVSTFLETELVQRAKHFFWTDSRIVLGYIKNETKRFHVFVANRVNQIRERTLPHQWRHVDSKDNPADAASRGLSVEQMESSSWFDGPNFLWEKEIKYEHRDEEVEVSLDDPEVKRIQVKATTGQQRKGFELDRLNRFSSWYQAKMAVANCLRFKTYLHRRCKERSQGTMEESERVIIDPVSVELLQEAEREIIRQIQREDYKDEFPVLEALKKSTSTVREKRRYCKIKSRLHRLDPFLDDHGIIRVGGRLKKFETEFEVRHPAILPQCHLSRLIVAHCHAEVAHQGRGMTVNYIRDKGFWILGCSHFVSKYISKCVTCNKLRRPSQIQKMANLPKDRLTPAPPFTHCGVDCFGPWLIREGRKEMKRYGLIFTCMASRAIHLETLNSMNTDSFINGLRRFMAIRGPIRQLRSDRGTNFVGAERELAKAWKEMDHQRVKAHLLSKECDYFEFCFNFPHSSHMGGIWERLIRSVRRVLETLLYQHGQQLDDEGLRTLFSEAAAIVNSRPLTVEFANDPTCPEPLTPNHLLTQKSRVTLPPPGKFVREDLYSTKRWRRVQHLSNEFWCRWKKEFLSQLQSRQKWTKPQRNMTVGDIVLIKDDNVPRNSWPMAIITEVYTSDDNCVRKVRVLIGNRKLDKHGKSESHSYLDRPVHSLVLLLAKEDQA